MNANSTRNVVVESGGDPGGRPCRVARFGVVRRPPRRWVRGSHRRWVGLGPGVPVHDRGRVLCQAMLMLAGGGESCTDIESLAAQGRLFGDVCSDSTLYRTFTDRPRRRHVGAGPPSNRQDPRRSVGTHTGGDRW